MRMCDFINLKLGLSFPLIIAAAMASTESIAIEV
jgi:hypothetical protein